MRRALLLTVLLAGCRQNGASGLPGAGATPASGAAGPFVSASAPSTPALASAAASASALASAAPSASAPASLPSVPTDWCIDGVPALDEDVCYVLPALPSDKPRRLLVYLHGITPPTPSSPQKDTVQNAVRHASLRAGVAALVPRGRRGIGPDFARDWWAWPTSPATHTLHAASIVARIVAAKKKLEAITGSPFERVYLAGSSNGAYFLTALAMRGDADRFGLSVYGYGAMSGGATGGMGADALAGRAPHAFYIGYGAYDDESKKNAKGLATVLESARWPLRVREHPTGHGARERYLDEAFEFWSD